MSTPKRATVYFEPDVHRALRLKRRRQRNRSPWFALSTVTGPREAHNLHPALRLGEGERLVLAMLASPGMLKDLVAYVRVEADVSSCLVAGRHAAGGFHAGDQWLAVAPAREEWIWASAATDSAIAMM
jgi:hypothetical protein